jgi:diguanylate cyclase (GGDEF)-like protein
LALLILTLLVGTLLTFYVGRAQDEEMRDNLTTYANTIERSIDWKPFATVLNTDPKQLTPADLKSMEAQLNAACKANRDCHFIYLLYLDQDQVKFMLDASPQPPSEISKLEEVFVEATDALKRALLQQKALVEGPVTDRWGTWVSARVPVKLTINSNYFVMLNIDVAVTGWQSRIFKKTLVPIIFTLLFSGILFWFVWQSRQKEQQLAELFNSTSKLRAFANNDDLTGLPNRRLLEDRMAQAQKTAKRTQSVVAILFLDLDHFKAVNDVHGHDVGDQLLKLVAERLTQLLRAEDTVARVGGDEFVVLLPDLSDEKQAIVAAEKIVSELVKPFIVANHVLQLGASVGIAIYPDHDADLNNLIKFADSAMYAAKRQGRNCYVIYNGSFSGFVH